MNTSAISYTVSAFTFFIFLVVLLTDKHKGATKQSLVMAASLSCIWSFQFAYNSLATPGDRQIPFLEFLKNISWIVLLVHMLGVAYGARF